jgi:hypothetical protein
MREMIVRISGVLSLVLYILVDKCTSWISDPSWQLVFRFIGAAGFAAYLMSELNYYRKMSGTTFVEPEKDSKIANYMKKWISTSGKIAIFSRNMTWADEPSVKEILTEKAKKDELVIYLPENIPLAKELKASGASVFTYEKLNFKPTSRFTIINFGRDGARIAIGRAINKDEHKIEEFSAGEHPAFWLAMDLLEVLDRCRKA